MDNDGWMGVPAEAEAGAEPPERIEAARVARFLAANPDWLATQTGLYERLSPPRRVHGDALADHMAAMIDVARHNSRTALDAGRAALGLSERVKAAVLALIRAADPGDWIAGDLPHLLGVDAARLCMEARLGVAPGAGGCQGGVAAAGIPPGTSARLLGGRDVLIRRQADPADAALLHGEAAGLALHEAVLRVPVPGAHPMLLALAMRDATVLVGPGSDTALAFLAASLAARIERA